MFSDGSNLGRRYEAVGDHHMNHLYVVVVAATDLHLNEYDYQKYFEEPFDANHV